MKLSSLIAGVEGHERRPRVSLHESQPADAFRRTATMLLFTELGAGRNYSKSGCARRTGPRRLILGEGQASQSLSLRRPVGADHSSRLSHPELVAVPTGAEEAECIFLRPA